MSSYFDLKNKSQIASGYMNQFVDITRNMFEWDNLPKSVPRRQLEKIIQKYGHSVIIEHKNELWACKASIGQELDPYYMPTKAIVTNPWLGVNKTYEIGKNCAIVYNDSARTGLYNMLAYSANFLAECDSSLRIALINSRIPTLLSSADATAIKSAETYMEHVEKGDLAILLETPLAEELFKLNSTPFEQSTDRIIPLIELRQYWKGSTYMDLGIKAPFNMKREALGDSENGLQDMGLMPFVEDMLQNRQEGAEMVKDVFGVTWVPKLSGVWKKAEDGNIYGSQNGGNDEKDENTQ